MQNPAAVSDTTGEWFEVYNATGHAIDLNGWMLQDAGTEHHRIQNNGPLWLPAHGYLVLGRNADPTRNGAVGVAYQYGGFTLGNTDDEIILLDGRTPRSTAWPTTAARASPTPTAPPCNSSGLIWTTHSAPTGASHPIPGPAVPATAVARRRQPGHTPNVHGHGDHRTHYDMPTPNATATATPTKTPHPRARPPGLRQRRHRPPTPQRR